jgi:hypothetical protein
MATQTPDLAAIVKRLEKLERQHRLFRWATGVLAALAVTATAVATAAFLHRNQGPQGGDVIEAREFVVRDSHGQRHASFRFNEAQDWPWQVRDQPVLEFYGDWGLPRIRLGVDEGGASLMLMGADSRSIAWFVANTDASGVTVSRNVQNGVGHEGAFAISKDGPLLSFTDVHGPQVILGVKVEAGRTDRVKVGVTKRGTSLALYDDAGKPVFSKP